MSDERTDADGTWVRSGGAWLLVEPTPLYIEEAAASTEAGPTAADRIHDMEQTVSQLLDALAPEAPDE